MGRAGMDDITLSRLGIVEQGGAASGSSQRGHDCRDYPPLPRQWWRCRSRPAKTPRESASCPQAKQSILWQRPRPRAGNPLGQRIRASSALRCPPTCWRQCLPTSISAPASRVKPARHRRKTLLHLIHQPREAKPFTRLQPSNSATNHPPLGKILRHPHDRQRQPVGQWNIVLLRGNIIERCIKRNPSQRRRQFSRTKTR